MVHPEVRRLAVAWWAALASASAASHSIAAQSSDAFPCHSPKARFLGAQATLIGQYLRPFSAEYSGAHSLTSAGDQQLSQSYGVYGGACIVAGLAVYVDVEMVRGAGIGHTLGLAGITNGDVLRAGSVDLGTGPYFARYFLRYTIPLSSKSEDTLTAAPDQLAGHVSSRRIEITAGRLALTDLLDLNRYANSTRSQFYDWVLFNDGAWDYAADTRGYSNGIAVAWVNPTWVLRVASFMMPTMANGNVFDTDIANARGDNVELTLALPHESVLRILAYVNHGRMGIYSDAIATGIANDTTPNIVADDAPGRVKYGFAVNGDVPLADSGETGAFGRIGWNDGKTESFVFTEQDSHLSLGFQLSGRHWRRHDDAWAIAFVTGGISQEHRAYLAAGGLGFLLGDGALNYGRENILETYYRATFWSHVIVSPDFMYIVNPGYNRARGPAVVFGLRLNVHT